DIDKAVNVVGPAVQKQHWLAIGWAGFGVADIQQTGIDLLQRTERSVRSRLDRGQFCLARLRVYNRWRAGIPRVLASSRMQQKSIQRQRTGPAKDEGNKGREIE